jgi:hypothetical protein
MLFDTAHIYNDNRASLFCRRSLSGSYLVGQAGPLAQLVEHLTFN